MFWMISLWTACTEAEKTEPAVALEPADTAEELESDPCETQVWYLDADGDGFGDPFGAMESCEALEGYVQNNEDCDDGDPQAYPDQVWYLDADGDGFGSAAHTLTQCMQPNAYVYNADDCDDWDSSKNPDSVWYLDSDGDGYGAESTTVESCLALENAVSNALDCDDSNMDIHPAASEECDYIDNDCDALIDNEDPSLNEYGEVAIYVDEDGDGFATDEYVAHACASSPLGSAVRGDCNDDDPEVYPGHFEWPDEIDSNCDGEPFFQRPDVFTQGHTLPSDQVADYLTSVDINGDGTLDLIVGQPTADNDTGKLFWVDGSTTADFSELDGTTNLWTGSTQGGEFGSSAVLIGDMNGNGTSDIMIGAPGEGKVYLFDSNTTGSTEDAYWYWQLDPSVHSGSSNLGENITPLGDIDGDGFPEVLVSDKYFEINANNSGRNEGAVFLLHSSQVSNTHNPTDGTYIRGIFKQYLGLDIANVGDVTGDGIDEVVVTARNQYAPSSPVYMFGVDAFTQNTVSVEDAIVIEADFASKVQGIGDFDGDGYRDVVIHNGDVWGNSTELGTIHIVNGSASFASSYDIEDAALHIDSSVSGNEFAREILPEADLNADGCADLIFSSPSAEYPMSANNTGHGMVFGVLGGTLSGTYDAVDVTDVALLGAEHWSSFGGQLANAGDVDADGQADFWIKDIDTIYLVTGNIFAIE